MIAAEGEHKASRALRHAAEVICDSPAALQVSGHYGQIIVIMVIVVIMFIMIILSSWLRNAAEVICESPAALQSWNFDFNLTVKKLR